MVLVDGFAVEHVDFYEKLCEARGGYSECLGNSETVAVAQKNIHPSHQTSRVLIVKPTKIK